MENIMPQLIASLSIALFAKFTIASLTSILANQSRNIELIATKENGKIEIFTAKSDLSKKDRDELVKSAIIFEYDIVDTIKKLEQISNAFKIYEGNNVDLILEANNGNRYGIEIKKDLDHLKNDDIDKYIKEDGEIAKLLLITQNPPSKEIKERLNKYQEKNILSYITLPKELDINTSLSMALHQYTQHNYMMQNHCPLIQ
ncbi:MAG: hypothetical protein HGA42_20480 [Nostocales cyanobacterium W4_Combined_metabat2_030]|nr:hypothetical protein [Nostocales cyanobacterium W4_Combined_metabat2_030]